MYDIKSYTNNLLNVQYYKNLPILTYKKYKICMLSWRNSINFEHRRSYAFTLALAPASALALRICDLSITR